MKIIFLKNVPGVARAYQVKEVADGYALNFVIPRKLGEKATEVRLKQLEDKRIAAEGNTKEADERWAKDCKLLDGKTVTITTRANDMGHLYEGVDAEKIAQEIQIQLHVMIPATLIKIAAPFKAVGTSQVAVEKGGKSATISLQIKAI